MSEQTRSTLHKFEYEICNYIKLCPEAVWEQRSSGGSYNRVCVALFFIDSCSVLRLTNSRWITPSKDAAKIVTPRRSISRKVLSVQRAAFKISQPIANYIVHSSQCEL